MRVLLIDGRSGSGKTELARRRAEQHGAQLLSLDDLYPGWNGLSAGSLAVGRALRNGGYRRYDWRAHAFEHSWMTITSSRPLVIEGCGAITRANLEAARTWAGQSTPNDEEAQVESVWLEAPEAVRRARALARDGEIFTPHWQEWAEQEQQHFSVHRPWELADEVIETA